MFVILWNEGAARGYRDILDEGIFSPSVSNRHMEHVILSKNSCKFTTARFSLNISETTAVLDYAGSNSEFNGKNLVELGQSKIVFSDDTFLEIISYEWRPEKGSYRLADVTIQDSSISESEAEGDPILARHIRRERNPLLIKRKIASVLESGRTLVCEACSFEFSGKYGSLGNGFYEVHHRTPLSEGVRITSMNDLAVLCANCHRMIHRTKPILSVEAFSAQHVLKPI